MSSRRLALLTSSLIAGAAYGAPIEWDAAGVAISGTTAGLAEDGALLARTAAGLQRIVSGEVRWR